MLITYFLELPARQLEISPIRLASFDNGGKAKERKQGGNPKSEADWLVFDGAQDGNRQVDPQIAVGGGFVLNATNSGLILYDKQGNYVRGISQNEFNGGIDPKLYFDPHNRVFCFDLWKYWDEAKIKPVNISVSETSDPRKGWNTYPVPSPDEVDGGGIGGSRKWLGYSFPGGTERTFVAKIASLKSGLPTTFFWFKGSLGHPVVCQDPTDDLYFVELTDKEIVIRTVGGKETPEVKSVVRAPHGIEHFGWPPQSPMKGTEAKTASGDRNPKNLVLQSGNLWFSQTVNVNGRASVQWHRYSLEGKKLMSRQLSDPVNSFIETTLAVNKRNQVIVGFQETGPQMFISGRAWFDGRIQKLGEGKAATEGGAWGDYSSSCVDGDNLLDLWTAQTVANESGRGSVVIARVRPR